MCFVEVGSTMLTEEQLEERLNYITGSDASAICGKSRYKSNLQLWMEKTRRSHQEDISQAPHIIFGNYMEDGVARWFSEITGKPVVESHEMLIHKEHLWMAGNIDRRVVGENAILECKTAMRADDWGDGENTIPDEYLLQVAHYCAVGNFDKAYIAVVFRLTGEFRWYEYDRNKTLEDKLIKREMEFWNNNVLADCAPDPLNEEDILLFYKAAHPDPLRSDENIEAYVDLYQKACKEIKALKDSKQKYKDQIALFMKDHEFLSDISGRIIATWKFTKPVNRFDAKSFENDHKDLYQKYIKQGEPQRRFKIEGNDE